MVILEEEMAELQKSCKLFEVSCPDSKQLKLCQRDITVLKQLWDLLLCAQVGRSVRFCLIVCKYNYYNMSITFSHLAETIVLQLRRSTKAIKTTKRTITQVL